MTVPVYLNSSFSYVETAPITDVDDIITAFRDEVLNGQTPAWTEPDTALFKSPPDGSGRWIDVLLTRIAANNLECRVRDSSGTTIVTGRMQIGTVSIVRIFTGQFHFHIETVGASPEFVRGGIVDLTPEAQSAHSQWAYGYTRRDTADALRSYCYWRSSAMIDNGTPAIVERGLGFCIATAAKNLQSASGAWIFGACGVTVKPPGDASNFRYAGRLYQQVVCPDDIPGSEFVVPIDTNSFGTFKIIGMPAVLSQRLAVRIA